MLNPVCHVLEPGVLLSGPAIRLQCFRIPAEGLQRLSEEIQDVRFFIGGERAHFQGLTVCHDGVIVVPRRQQT